METKNERSSRRTNSELEHDISEALAYLVERHGFTGITINDLVKVSKIEAGVFYRRYRTIDCALDILAQKYDFWLNKTIDTRQLGKLGAQTFYATVLKDLYSELLKNKVMQKLLIWELNEDNDTIRRSYKAREEVNLNLINYYDSLFKGSGIDIKMITSIFISSIYYIVIRRNNLLFCTIDFNSKESEKMVHKSIDLLVDMLFANLRREVERREMVGRMVADGLSSDKICNYMKISHAEYVNYTV